jgi:CRP-like cAMP-binding protein
MLILSGLVTVNIGLIDRVASQLAGPGDVLEPRPVADALLPVTVDHHVSETARIAVLDSHFVAAVRRWPGLLLVLHERLRRQERRLAVHAAIGKLRRVEDRVLALLWHLAEQWGRMAPDGVVVPLALTHETIGRLAGAARPTVSLALTALYERGDVRRRDDGAFVLDPDSLVHLASERRAVPQVRPLAAMLERIALLERVAALRSAEVESAREIRDLLERVRTSHDASMKARRLVTEPSSLDPAG